MSASELLVRASIDLRGVRPSPAELERVMADPERLGELLDAFVDDPRFASRMADLYGEVYLTRAEAYYVDVDDYDVEEISQAEFIESIGREPLEMIRHIAAEELPYTELVTGDWTMANEVTGAIWPIDRPTGEGWLRSAYTDERPSAGVLSTNALWWRYTSTDSNANRKRANAVSRILLCDDYLVRPIDFDRNVNLLDQDAVNDALTDNPSCVSCHVSLDPLASYFYGFWHYNQGSPADVSTYHPERENRWRQTTGIAPAYYGEPGYSLSDLGQQIASDPRFVECAVEQAWELLLRRDASLADTATLTEHREAFLAGGLTLRALYRSLLESPEYRAGSTDAPGYVPKKMVTPRLLASQVEGLTGYRWTREGFDLLASDSRGYLTLAGGADGYYVTEPTRFPNATLLLVQERLAESAAHHAVAHDREHPEDARLFDRIDWTETPQTDREAMVEQIQALHLALFGAAVAPDGPEVGANLELWSALYDVQYETPHLAWEGLLSALLRDPDMLFY